MEKQPDLYDRLATEYGLSREDVRRFTHVVCYYGEHPTAAEREIHMRAAIASAVAMTTPPEPEESLQ